MSVTTDRDDTITTTLLDALEFRMLGPHRGGRVVAVAGDVSDLATYYFGACAGGVWKTDDGGTTWRNCSDGFFKTAAVGAIAVSESDPNVIYAGMGETAIRGNVSHGDGVYKSTDGGRTWRNLGLKETRHIGRVRIHPTNPDHVYVAALGHAWGPNDERGVYRTRDGGMTWELVLHKSARAGSHDLSVDPTNPRILYASIWQAQRYPHQLVSGGEDSGIWKSTDGGDSWTDLTRKPGLPQTGVLGKIGVAASGARPGRVWAIVEHENGALFRSDDGGETWERLCEEPYLRTRAWYYMHIYADPVDAETVWILNYGLHKSIDGGKTFVEVPTPHGDNHDLWIDPARPRRMIEGNDGGACVTYNGGVSWSSIYNQPTAQMYHVTTDDRQPFYTVYGSQQDNSAIALPSASLHGAIHEREWFVPGGGESGYIAIKPDDPDIVVAGAIGSGNFNGRLIHYNHRTKQQRDITAWPNLAGMGSGAGELKHRFQWTFPAFFSWHDPDELYIAGNRVLRSHDQGASWEVVSDDLTRNDPSKLGPSGGPITRDNTGAEVYCTIFALVESPRQRGLLWAGSDDGLVHVSEDGGQTWENITPAELPEWALISMIEPSPHDASTIYLAATRYKHDDTQPYLFKTTDSGASWTRIDGGLPRDDFTRVIRQDPRRAGLLYVGTETGVYVSFDDGGAWRRLGGNLPVVPIYDLIVKGDGLLIATHGRSFWALDDLTQLRQVADAGEDTALTLLTPRDAVRVRVETGFGNDPTTEYVNFTYAGPSLVAYDLVKKPGGQTEKRYLNAGANPPAGVVITYILKEQPKETLTLDILDESGEVARTVTSRPPVDELVEQGAGEGREGAAAEDEGDQQPAAPAAAGVNRFVWDMRHPGPAPLKGQKLSPWERPVGPLVVPGTYQVRVTVGGQTATQSFQVLADERLAAMADDLRQQRDLLMQVRDKLSEVHLAIGRVRDIREQAAAWTKRARDVDGAEEAAAAAQALKAELDDIEDQLLDTHTKSPLMFPARLSEKLAALMGFLDSADYAPARQGRDVFAELSTAADAQLKRVDDVVRTQVAALNDAVTAARISAVG